MSWYLIVMKNYLGFSGRARRKEYWFFQLFNFIILVILSGLDFIIFMLSDQTIIGMLTGAYLLGSFLPGIAVTFRRFHDSGKSAWWWLINFVPMVGTLIYLFILFLDSEPGNNKYGPYPKQEFESASTVI